MKTEILTQKFLNLNKTPKGGYTKAQLRLIGVALAKVFKPANLLLSKGGKNENKILTKYFNYGEFAVIGGAL